MRVRRIDAETLNTLAGIIRLYKKDGYDQDFSGFEGYGGLFLIDLWHSPLRGQPTDIYDQIEAWLEEMDMPNERYMLTLATRLVAIPDRDDAFHFYMRFR